MRIETTVFNRWKTWAEKIKEDLVEVLDDQQTFLGFSNIVQANWDHLSSKHGSRFCFFVRRSYAVHAAAAVRRHLKAKDEDSISLMKLLKQIKKCASQFTYDFYIEQYPLENDKTDLPWQKSTFSMFSRDCKVLSEEIIQKDIDALEALGSKIEDYVDRRIAHLDHRGWDGNVTYDDIKVVLDQINEIACRYLSLINASGLVSLERIIAYDWKQVFNSPFNVVGQDLA